MIKYKINKMHKAKKFKKKWKISPVKSKKMQKLKGYEPYLYPADIKIDDIGLLCGPLLSSRQYMKKKYKPKNTESCVHSEKRKISVVHQETSEVIPKKTSKLSSSKRKEIKDLTDYHHLLAVERQDRFQYIMERYENDSRNEVDDLIDFNDFSLISKSGESRDFDDEDYNPDGYIFSVQNAQHVRKLIKSGQMNVKSSCIRKKVKRGKLSYYSKKHREKSMLKSPNALNYSVSKQSKVPFDSDLDETLPCYSTSKQFNLKSNLTKKNYAPNKSFSFVDLGRTVSFMSTTTTSYKLDIENMAQNYDFEDSLFPAESEKDINESKIPPSSKKEFSESKSSLSDRDLLDKEKNCSVMSFSSKSGKTVSLKSITNKTETGADLNTLMKLRSYQKNICKSYENICSSVDFDSTESCQQNKPSSDLSILRKGNEDKQKVCLQREPIPNESACESTLKSAYSSLGSTSDNIDDVKVQLKDCEVRLHKLKIWKLKYQKRCRIICGDLKRKLFINNYDKFAPNNPVACDTPQNPLIKGSRTVSSPIRCISSYKNALKYQACENILRGPADSHILQRNEVEKLENQLQSPRKEWKCIKDSSDVTEPSANFDGFAFTTLPQTPKICHDESKLTPRRKLLESASVTTSPVKSAYKIKNHFQDKNTQNSSDAPFDGFAKPTTPIMNSISANIAVTPRNAKKIENYLQDTLDKSAATNAFEKSDSLAISISNLPETPKSSGDDNEKLKSGSNSRCKLYKTTVKNLDKHISSSPKPSKRMENRTRQDSSEATKLFTTLDDIISKSPSLPKTLKNLGDDQGKQKLFQTSPMVNTNVSTPKNSRKRENQSLDSNTSSHSGKTQLFKNIDDFTNRVAALPEVSKSAGDDNEKHESESNSRCKLYKTTIKNLDKHISSSPKTSKKREDRTRQDSSEATKLFTTFDDIINKAPSLPKTLKNLGDDQDKQKLFQTAPMMNLTHTNVLTPRSSRKRENQSLDSNTSSHSNKTQISKNIDDFTNRIATLPEIPKSFGDGYEKTKYKSRRELFKTTCNICFTSKDISSPARNTHKVHSPLQNIPPNSSEAVNQFDEFDALTYPSLPETCKSFADVKNRPKLTPRSKLFKTTNLNSKHISSSTKHFKKTENKSKQDSPEATEVFSMSDDFINKHPSLPETPKSSANCQKEPEYGLRHAKNLKKAENQIQDKNSNSEFKRIHPTNQQTLQPFVDPPKSFAKRPKYTKKFKLSKEISSTEDQDIILMDNPPYKSTTDHTLTVNDKYKSKKVAQLESTVQGLLQHNSIESSSLETFEFVQEDSVTPNKSKTSSKGKSFGNGHDIPKKRLSKPKAAHRVSSSPKRKSPTVIIKGGRKLCLMNNIIETGEIDVLSSPSVNLKGTGEVVVWSSPSVKSKTFNKTYRNKHIDNSILCRDKCTITSPLINSVVPFLKTN